jgi:hypothetical protein
MRCGRVATVVEILEWAMATIQENSDEHEPVRDFAWHCTHRARRPAHRHRDVGGMGGGGRLGSAESLKRQHDLS